MFNTNEEGEESGAGEDIEHDAAEREEGEDKQERGSSGTNTTRVNLEPIHP